MLLDQGLSLEDEKRQKLQQLTIETGRWQTLNFIFIGIASILVTSEGFSVRSFDTATYNFIFFAVIEILIFAFIAFFVAGALNFIPYKTFTYLERYLRMFWITLGLTHLSSFLLIAVTSINPYTFPFY